MSGLLTLADVEAARDLIADVVRLTPLEPCRPVAAKLGGPVWLKCEHLQRAGSFKVRGAYVRISRLSPAERARGVVAASAGNHAQGVALAAGLLGAATTVFMPIGAPLPGLGLADEVVRRDFADSAFWSANVRTDKTGKASASFKIPDSLTNWRVQVIKPFLVCAI